MIFEESQNFCVVYLESRIAVNDNPDIIVDKVLQDHFLWLLFKTGEIVIVDISNSAQIKIFIENDTITKFFQLARDKTIFFFISESGECLAAPYSSEELVDKFEEGCKELSVCLQKAPMPKADLNYNRSSTFINGLNISTEAGCLLSQCPLTGLSETISTSVNLKHIVPREDMAIIADKSNMWVADLKNSDIVFQFKNNKANIVPVIVYNNMLYYLVWDNIEVHVCCARIASSSLIEHVDDQEYTNDCTQNLSTEEILIAQLKLLTEPLLISAIPVEVSAQLLSLFEKIKDFDFLIETALKLCQHHIMYKSVLHPLQKRIYASGNTGLINVLSDLIIKVDLLEYINFRGNNGYKDVNLFEKTFKELCVTFMSKSDLDIASICWLKYSELKSLIVVSDDIVDILNSIPCNTKMGAIIIWLKNFAPCLLEQNPYYIDLFVRWAMERIFILEQSGYWPKIGLKFIEEIAAVLETSLTTICVRPISMDDLDMLKDRINYILELKEKYKINMLLAELSSQSPSEVALIMLRRCYTEDLEALLQDYLPTYATRHLFDMDDTLHSFIENETASSGGVVDGTRLKIILGAFRSLSNKLDCLLQVLKVLDVPWNSTVLELAVAAAASATKDFTVSDADRILAQEIQQQLNYAEVKVVLKKYNFPMTCVDYTLVLHKLINAQTVELSDLKAITTVMSTYANYGNVLYIDKCLDNCDTRSALDYFNNLSNNEKSILLKTMTTKYEQIVNGHTNDMKSTERNYLDFLKGTGWLNAIQINDIENLYHFKHSYNMKLSLNNINSESNCANEVNTWWIHDEAMASSGRGGSVFQITEACEARYSLLLTLLRRTSGSHKVRMLVETLIKSQQKRDRPSAEHTESVLSNFKNGQNSSLLIDSCHILIELITKCREENLHYLIQQLSILNALVSANIVVQNLTITWKFNYVFLPISSSTAVNELINFLELSNITKLSYDNFLTYLRNSCNECDFIPFRIISNAAANLDITGLISCNEILEIKDKLAKRLLSKMVASQDLDEVLITNLLLVLRSVELIENKFCILDALRGPNECLPPALITYLSTPPIRRTFSLDTNSQENGVTYPPQYILKSKFNINLSDMALPENTEETWDVKIILFYVLRQCPNTSFERLVDLCRALNVSTNDGLSLQLISILSAWDLKYKMFNDELGCRQIKLENDESLLEKCSVVWESIDNKDFLKDILNDFWKNGEVTLHGRIVSINPYYYEVFLCIYHLLFDSSLDVSTMREYFLLTFLKEYKRKSAPKQYEFELFSVKGMFPEIGFFRLPFHLFKREDMWSNIKSEITLETYERWLPAVSLLSLDSDSQTAKDMICSNALKQTMTSRKRDESNEIDKKETEPWRLTTREEPLLRAAHRCVRHIANMEWAGACLFYVLQGCTRGADQVAAAHLCYQFAQRWAAIQPGNRAVRQMERLHATLSTRHALHKIEWACEQFVKLLTEPAQLIRTMYLHPDFVQKIARHDVNRAANEIADKNGINISSIRIQILENLLEKSNEENKSNFFYALDTKELMTAKYILKATCPKMGAIYLSRIAFDDESDYNKCKKLRALQCLMSVVEPDTAIKVTNRGRDALWMSLVELLCIVKLEHIDMPWTVVTFMQDKIRALEQLLQAAEGNIDGLRTTAELAYRFGNSKIIRDIIPLLLRCGLYEEIIPLLLKSSNPPDSVICAAWRAVILAPFQRADYPITERQRIKCLNAINLLPICPVIKDEDLKEIWNNCVRCKCVGLGCLLLPYMTSQTRQTLPELTKIDRRNLIASLKNLHTETFLVSGAMHVIQNMSSRAYR